MGKLLNTIAKRNARLRKAAGLSTKASAAPAKKRAKARTHIKQFTDKELVNMDLNRYMKLDR